MVKNLLCIACCIGFFVLIEPSAFAQTPEVSDQRDLYELTLEEVMNIKITTVTKKSQRYNEAPATIVVITEEQIKNRGYRNLLELLEDVPEIEVQRNSHSDYKNQVGIRGIAGNEKFIIMQDGIRFTPATGDGIAIESNYSLANAKQVEVVLGPASALYGVDAFSGIINIITKNGEDVRGGNATISYGQFNTTDNSFVAGTKVNDLAFSVTGSMTYSDEPYMPKYYPKEYAWYTEKYKPEGVMGNPFDPTAVIATPYTDREFEIPSSSYYVGSKLKFKDFEIGYTRNFLNHSTSIGTPAPFTIFSKEARIESNMEIVYARHNYTSENEKFNLQSTISTSHFEWGTESGYMNAFTHYEKGYKYLFGSSYKIEEQVYYAFSKKYSIVGGFSYENLAALPPTGDLPVPFKKGVAANSQHIPYLGTNVTDMNGKDLTIYQDFFYLNYVNVGSYLQLQLKPADIIEFTIGGRYDYNTRYGSSINPRFGAVLSPTDKIKWKLLYGESFLAPSPFKAYAHYGSFYPATDDEGNITGLASTFFQLPNPDLKPEKLRSWETSFSYLVTSKLSVSANAYYNKIDDLINVYGHGSDITSFKGVDVGFISTVENAGSSETYGGTVRLNYMQNFGSFKLNPYAAYTYSDGHINNDQLLYNANHTVKVGVDFSTKKLSVSPRVQYRSVSYSDGLNHGEDQAVDPFTLVNLFARYKAVEKEAFKVSVFSKINNLTNIRYHNAGLDASPQDPMRITMGVSVDF